ncbi:hypothetical protein NAI69_09605, partial [Francisella tularensis subsp. holarctica]|uniref:hypothetical protein n=1 Tax=Francisella tularensis TaxID=263 RepID=UPI002381AD53
MIKILKPNYVKIILIAKQKKVSIGGYVVKNIKDIANLAKVDQIKKLHDGSQTKRVLGKEKKL